ncbi:inorganic diphosphatase [Candidatus Saccharibacteria bacterium]|jgi:inorganic pyrophosphatase|nr:inorganic diphosphatase [Candidatus Saccharibacteria bacterium]
MPDYNVILDAGDVEGGIVNTVIEIPRGSMMKVEWNRKLATFELDRVEPGIFAKPANYGFIPQTLDEDGDELDTVVITEEGIATGVFLKARVIGVINFEDGGEMDHKIVCVPEDDRHYGKITSLDELSAPLKGQLEHHFNHYKDLKKPGTTIVMGWGDIDAAKVIIRESIERYKNEA